MRRSFLVFNYGLESYFRLDKLSIYTVVAKERWQPQGVYMGTF